MKKNVLALSITAALVGIGFTGGAQAIGLLNMGAQPVPPGLATTLKTSADGIGHILFVPYYTAQGANNTMINLVNTDTTNGKAVKVRFRGAANSDDVYDFQVFLSPGDVWTGAVNQDVDGKTRLTTADASCTKPTKAALNATAFSTVRVDPNRTAAGQLNETREGYTEIFNMADIPPNASTSSLYYAIKHKNSVAPCTGAAWTALDTDPLNATVAHGYGLLEPTTGLFANWIILNVADAGSWSGRAPAVLATDGFGVATTGALTYFPQTNAVFPSASASRIAQFTADPVLIANPSMARTYDVPDLSIPYGSTSLPTDQATLLTAALATRSVINEFLTNSAINATTDWVLSMPTRRYSAAYDYAAKTSVFTTLGADYFTAANTTVIDRQICVTGINSVSYDQEENTAVNPGADVIISPQPPTVTTNFVICGEASVLAFNGGERASASGLVTTASGTLKATVARSAVENGYSAGWSILTTPGILNNGLPVVGYEAVRATSGASTFGATLEHRTDRLIK
jgi:hypothetical protein